MIGRFFPDASRVLTNLGEGNIPLTSVNFQGQIRIRGLL